MELPDAGEEVIAHQQAKTLPNIAFVPTVCFDLIVCIGCVDLNQAC